MAFKPLNSGNSMPQNFSQVNDMIRQLNREQVAKTFKQPGGANAVVNGKLPYLTSAGNPAYGSLYYDENGIPSIIIGITPDGKIDIVAAKEGENVIDAFS